MDTSNTGTVVQPKPQPQTPPPTISPEAKIERERLDTRRQELTINLYEQAMQVQTNFLNPNVWQQIRAMGRVFFDSKAIPSSIVNEAQLVMVLQAGFEAGMTPIESISSLYIVNGNINIYGKAVTRRFRNHGWKIEYSDETDAGCTATVSKGDEAFQETYLYKDAEKSGYTVDRSGSLKVGWKEGINRKLKLRYGALSIILKSYLPDVLGNFADIKEIAEDYEQPKELKTTNLPRQEIIKNTYTGPNAGVTPLKAGGIYSAQAEGGDGNHISLSEALKKKEDK